MTAPKRSRPKRRGRIRRRRARWLLACALSGAGGVVLGAAALWASLRLAETGLSASGRARAPDPLRTPPGAYDWREHPPPAFPVPPYARFLEGVTIVLDPGHGGRADRLNWKRGPTGLREAEVNLRVAEALREFLTTVGAEVILTREADVYLHPDDARDLSLRIAMANERRADLFLSIHHNAADSPSANYTTVFYHGRAEDHPASVDAARNLVSGLDDALRLEQRVGVALVSDFEIYPGEGFRVLREARVPAVLTEASFHSNPQEEQRLRDPLYNCREAYGLFLGLARWAQAGLPRVRLASDRATQKPGSPLVLRLDDGLSSRGGIGTRQSNIRESSVVVRLVETPAGGAPASAASGRPLAFSLDAKRAELRVTLPARLPPDAHLYVNFANTFGQHVLHPWLPLSSER